MLFSDSYYSINASAQAIYKDKGSKFLAFAFPVSSEAEIKAHLQQLRKEHPSASHYCYAWILGPDKAAFRANDDGEPANTAGKPILSQIQSKDLTNIVVIVVRYFGGTLLGVGGLIQAYKQAAAEVLNKVAVEENFIFFEYNVEFGFETISPVMRLLKENEAKIILSTYEDTNTIVFRVKKMYADALEHAFRDLYTTKLKFLRVV